MQQFTPHGYDLPEAIVTAHGGEAEEDGGTAQADDDGSLENFAAIFCYPPEKEGEGKLDRSTHLPTIVGLWSERSRYLSPDLFSLSPSLPLH